MSGSVVVRSSSRLSCSSQETPDVVLCLDSDELLASGNTTIDGTITKSYKNSSGCGCNCAPSWSYIVQYDTSLLADADTVLTTDDVTGIFCKGCLTTWVEELVGSGTSALGGKLYIEDGELKYLGGSGTITILAPA